MNWFKLTKPKNTSIHKIPAHIEIIQLWFDKANCWTSILQNLQSIWLLQTQLKNLVLMYRLPKETNASGKLYGSCCQWNSLTLRICTFCVIIFTIIMLSVLLLCHNFSISHVYKVFRSRLNNSRPVLQWSIRERTIIFCWMFIDNLSKFNPTVIFARRPAPWASRSSLGGATIIRLAFVRVQFSHFSHRYIDIYIYIYSCSAIQIRKYLYGNICVILLKLFRCSCIVTNILSFLWHRSFNIK